MRKLKIVAVLLTVCVLIGVYLSSAFALGDGLAALGEYFGLSNPTSRFSSRSPFGSLSRTRESAPAPSFAVQPPPLQNTIFSSMSIPTGPDAIAAAQ